MNQNHKQNPFTNSISDSHTPDITPASDRDIISSDIEEYSQNLTSSSPSFYYSEHHSDPKDSVHEAVSAYVPHQKRQGEYTLEDYLNWPQDEHVELIDGEIIKMDSPIPIHQSPITSLTVQIYSYIQKKHGTCIVLPGPVDVQLDQDDKTVVVPDMIILCDKDKLRNGRIFGAPDFILEVLSPSSRSHDLIRKKQKYINAGVREYWIIDLEKERLLTYTRGHDYGVSIYPLSGKVGVELYNYELMIDLDQLKQDLAFFL